jgi:putative acetyltransferase
MIIRRTTNADLKDILSIHQTAFPDESVADLTAALLSDRGAKPFTSLIALDGKAVGHILFTAAHLWPETPHRVALLAPLAVLPEVQRQGIGKALVYEGLLTLARAGENFVFVLGHPSYYPKFGFVPAGQLGFSAPYPIAKKHANAWMIKVLNGELPHSYTGTVQCAPSLDHPELWRE